MYSDIIDVEYVLSIVSPIGKHPVGWLILSEVVGFKGVVFNGHF